MTAFLRRDTAKQVTKALPNGAAATSSDPIDMEQAGQMLGHFEFLIEAPALGATPLPDAKTMIYKLQHAVDAAFTSPIDLALALITQTGAGGVGAVAASKRFRPPSDCLRYVRVTATGSASGDASAAVVTLSLMF